MILNEDETIITELLTRGFHEPEDWVFVFAALASDLTIVSEDSDYGIHGEADKKPIYDYLSNELGLLLLSADDALKQLG